MDDADAIITGFPVCRRNLSAAGLNPLEHPYGTIDQSRFNSKHLGRKLQTMQYVKLNDQLLMPMVGYGTYRTPISKTRDLVAEAIEIGYRSIDTAQCYGNESGVGEAVRNSSIPREDFFLTTKTWTTGYKDTKRSIDRSLQELQTDYVDLLLIHEPTGDIAGIYRALEDAYEAGKARAIGLSNFMGETLRKIVRDARIKPAVDQVETHPLRQQWMLQRKCEGAGIVMESWSPLVAGNRSLLNDPMIEAIAQDHGRKPAQIVLRWLVQRGIPVIPKSTSREHMAENLEVFDFSFTDHEMDRMKEFDTDKSQFGWW